MQHDDDWLSRTIKAWLNRSYYKWNELKEENSQDILKISKEYHEHMSRWIPISESLPNGRHDVLAFWQHKGNTAICIDYYRVDASKWGSGQTAYTHWRELPTQPNINE